MRQMKDSGVKWIGEIPEDWKICRLKNYAKIMNGQDYKEVFDENGMYPVVGSGGAFSKANKYLYNGESVLLGRKGTVGRPLYMNSAFWTVDTMYYTLVNNNKCARYFYYLCTQISYDYYQYGSAVPSMTQRDLNSVVFPLPEYLEQCRIANYLDYKCSKIESIISKQEQIIGKLHYYKLSLISETVLHGLNRETDTKYSGYTFIGKIPYNWKVLRLRDIGTPQNGISKGGEYFGQGYPFVSYGDVYRNYSLPAGVSGLIESTDDERKKYSVEKGDIFFTRTSETIDEVGFSSVCEKTIENATFAGFLIRVRPKNDALDIGYAKYYFRSYHLREYLTKEMNLVTRASLGQGLLKSMPVLIPPKKEQTAIAQYLDRKCKSIDFQIQHREKLIEKLQDYKRSLIFECVTGKKETPVHPDDPLNTGIKPAVLNQIRNHAGKYGIRKVILFGSRARGTFRRDSDIDLAVSGGSADLFRLAMEEETDTLLTFDVVDIEHTSNEELLDEIRREGVVLYEEV